jgi:transcriptional regulator with XRE-family HTH domain
MSIKQLALFLRKRMKEVGLKDSGTALAKKAGMSAQGVNKILRGDTTYITHKIACKLN